MFAGYFFYSLPLSLYIAVTVIKFLSVKTVICSSDSVTVSVQFVVALNIAITVKQLKNGNLSVGLCYPSLNNQGIRFYWEEGGGEGCGWQGGAFSPSSKRGISGRKGVWTFKESLYHTP